MTWYQRIKPVGEILDLGLDDARRCHFAFNIQAVKAYSETFFGELAKILVTAGVGVLNTTLFFGSKAVLPDAPDVTFVHVKETGGPPPIETHNSTTTPAYPRPSAQVNVYAPTYAGARTKAYAAYRALYAVRNTNVVP